MRDEYSFSIDEATLDNFRVLSRLESKLCERRLCELYESASVISSALAEYREMGMNVYEMFSLLAGSLDLSMTDRHDGALPENHERLSKCLSSLSLLDRAAFSSLLLERLAHLGVKITETDFLPAKNAPETFVYVKNAFADEAYDVLSQDFKDPRVSYAADFKEAVRQVLDGVATYALLPLEERGGNRIQTVAQLIFSSELRINAVTPVFGFDGSADMKYAIVSRHFTVPRRRSGDDRYLEIRLLTSGSHTLAELLTVGEYLGHSLYRVSSVSFDSEDGEGDYFSVVLRDDGRDFTELLAYLTLFTETYTPVGIYKNLE